MWFGLWRSSTTGRYQILVYILLAVNLRHHFTPPFGFALFYMKGIAPREIKIQSIYKGIIPFVILQALGVSNGACIPRYCTGSNALRSRLREERSLCLQKELFIAATKQAEIYFSQGVADSLIALVYKIRAFVDWCGRWASLLFVPMIVITVYDVCLRKTGKLQIDLKYA